MVTGFEVLWERYVTREGWSTGFPQPSDRALRARQECPGSGCRTASSGCPGLRSDPGVCMAHLYHGILPFAFSWTSQASAGLFTELVPVYVRVCLRVYLGLGEIHCNTTRFSPPNS